MICHMTRSKVKVTRPNFWEGLQISYPVLEIMVTIDWSDRAWLYLGDDLLHAI